MTIRFQSQRVQTCQAAPQQAATLEGKTYVYHHPDIALAINIALITGRPLLIEGPSGCGKSSLAVNVALSLGRRFYQHVVTNRSEAQELLWTTDNIRRLNDAQANQLLPLPAYIEPGALWWAMDPDSASQRGSTEPLDERWLPIDPDVFATAEHTSNGTASGAVVLIDEIDKADPDMPNGLLVPLGSLRFTVTPTMSLVAATEPPLVMITTNNERELPPAFLRRCVRLELPPPTTDTLIEIAQAVDPNAGYDTAFLRKIADAVQRIHQSGDRSTPCSTAEYLDTVRACHELNLTADSADFERLTRIVLQTSPRDRDESNWS
ncbi:AAA family ATPase [Stieleria varia]|uniref:AAA family ATPase n=1 Tax=Stieleria varia TaxID=2528005 RepID=UPI0018D23BAF|nr:MoxR family ATPase [Stieleria varia]